MYWKYFKYIVEHKINVGIECFKEHRYVHMLTHDMSKFRPSEFFPYARFFMLKNRTKEYKTFDEDNKDFQKGWCLHQKRNKHHWNYWVSVTRKEEIILIPMPMTSVIHMVCDWKGMSRKFGGTANKYYMKNKDNMILHDLTKQRIHIVLNY